MSVPSPPLVGREVEVARVSDLLNETARGLGRILLIEGEAGIGKTRIVDEAVAQAQDLGFSILRSAGEELERRRPFGVLADALQLDRRSSDERRAAIAQMLVGEAGTDPAQALFALAAEAEFRIAEAMLVLLEDLCAQAPMALAVEDLQWADPASLMVLHRLGRRVEALPIFLIGTLRPVPRPPDLTRLLGTLEGQGASHLPMTPLDDPPVIELVWAMIGAEPGPNLIQQVKGAAGNPLFVTELVGTLQREGRLNRITTEQVDVAPSAPPPSLRLTFLHRLGFLPEEALELLRVASVLGSIFSVDDLSVVLRRPVVELVGPLEECLRAGVLNEEGERLAFRHDLIREALYEDLPEAVRSGLHLQAGRALAAAGRPPEQVAEHLGRGASSGDRQAVQWLHRAASEAASRSPSVALEILDRALALTKPSDPGRDELLAEQAVSLMWSGRLPEAENLSREILRRHHDPSVDGRLRWVLAHRLISGGRSSEAISELLWAISSEQLDPAERVRLQAWASIGLMVTGDLAGSQTLAQQALVGAHGVGDDLATCIALATLGATTSFRGRFAEGHEMLDRAVEVADRTEGRQGHRFHVHLYRGMLAMNLDRFDEARADIARGRRLGEELGVRWNLPFYHWASNQERFWAGAWDDAIAEYEAGMEVAEDTGAREGVIHAASVRSLIALHRGDLSTAEATLKIAEHELETSGPQYGLDWLMLARALFLEAAGKLEQGAAVLSNAWGLATSAGLAASYPVLGPDVVRVALAAGDRPLAHAAADALEELQARNEGIASLAGITFRCRGLAEADPDLHLEAVSAYRESPRPFELALATEDAALALGGAGRAGHARALLDEAVAALEALGAARDVARAEAGFRALGIRRGRRGSRRRPRFGWEALTEREAKVVALVAEGLSNPQIAERLFLSRHTVHTHVSHALAKLGLSSRVELATAAARRGT